MTGNIRIATLTLNPALDQTVMAPGFAVDQVNRAQSTHTDVGGKGINVASFLHCLGHKVIASGLLGKNNDGLFADHFAQTGIVDRCVRVDGATRTNIKIVNPVSAEITDLNFSGPEINAESLDEVRAALKELVADGVKWLALCGSLPKSVPNSIYAELISWATDAGLKTALDASGPALEVALKGKPTLVKPNTHELGEVLDCEINSVEDALEAAQQLLSQGLELVAISMGTEGAVICTQNEAVHAVAKAPKIVSTVGAGDAMVSGLLHGQIEGLSLSDTARFATSLSLGVLGITGPHLPPHDQLEKLAQTVVITPLSIQDSREQGNAK